MYFSGTVSRVFMPSRNTSMSSSEFEFSFTNQKQQAHTCTTPKVLMHVSNMRKASWGTPRELSRKRMIPARFIILRTLPIFKRRIGLSSRTSLSIGPFVASSLPSTAYRWILYTCWIYIFVCEYVRYICIYMYMCIRVFVCIYIYIYIYTYIFIHICLCIYVDVHMASCDKCIYMYICIKLRICL